LASNGGTAVVLEKFRKDLKEGFVDIQALWGMIFRAIFIFSICILAYNLIDSYDIGDIPVAQLTLKAIFGRIFAIAIVIGCTIWFFRFPIRMEKNDQNPYITWAQSSYYLVAIAVVIHCLFNLRR
jgi:hypothetical protein